MQIRRHAPRPRGVHHGPLTPDICGEEAAGDERRLVEEASLWRARRREAVAAAPGRGGLARGARGEVGLRGSERKHGEEEERSNEFSP